MGSSWRRPQETPATTTKRLGHGKDARNEDWQNLTFYTISPPDQSTSLSTGYFSLYSNKGERCIVFAPCGSLLIYVRPHNNGNNN